MAHQLKLVPGVEQPRSSPEDAKRREAVLRATVAYYLPDFVRAVEKLTKDKVDLLYLHQDAFASGYHTDEYTLLGCAIKFAGLYGITVQMGGKNGETCKGPEKSDTHDR